ncbi:MAG: TonB-dependent receptor [bacterium]|nr:TonB-dependent receptor [bacterium]
MRRLRLSFLFFFIGIWFPGMPYAQEAGMVDITLDELLNLKISTVAKYEQTTREAPASVTIITSKDIDLYGYQTLEEVFKGIRGFYVSNDRNYSYVGIRGFSRPTDYNNRVLLLLNGHTLNESIWGSAGIGTGTPIDLDTVERVEIVRGPGSALYGTYAMFAVVNVITKSGNTTDGLKVDAEMGSYSRRQGSMTFGKEFDNGTDIFISALGADVQGQDLYYQEFDDPATNQGIAQDLDWDKYYALLATFRYGDFTLQGYLNSREKGIPTGPWEVSFNDQNAKTLDQRRHINLKYDRKLGADKHLLLRGYYDHYHYRGWYPYDALYLDESDGHWVGSEFQFLWDTRPNNRLTFGAEYQNHFRAHYRTWDENNTYFDGDFPNYLFSLYAQNEYEIVENLTLTAGIRRDSYSMSGSTITPRGAVVFSPVKSSTFKLLYGEAFRAPNIYETYYDDEFSGFKSNLDLMPEKIRTMEVVWEQQLSEVLFSTVSLYNYRMRHLIDQQMDPSDELIQHRNVNRVKARGVELELNARLKAGIQGYASYVFQQAKDTDLNQRLTNSPAHTVKMGLAFPIARHFYAAPELQYESERITVQKTKTDPYLLTNVKLSAKPQPEANTPLGPVFNHLNVSFLVRNLFNTDYRTPGGFEHLQPAIAQDGRNYAVRIEYEF